MLKATVFPTQHKADTAALKFRASDRQTEVETLVVALTAKVGWVVVVREKGGGTTLGVL